MTDLARKRAVRATSYPGHRGVITKLTKEADSILSEEFPNEEIQVDKLKARLQTIDAMLQTKLTVVKALDEQVLELCETAEISKEVEDADEIESRVLDMRNLIAENRTKSLAKAKNTSKNGAVNHETLATTNEIQSPNLIEFESQQTIHNLETQASSSPGTSSVEQQTPDLGYQFMFR